MPAWAARIGLRDPHKPRSQSQRSKEPTNYPTDPAKVPRVRAVAADRPSRAAQFSPPSGSSVCVLRLLLSSPRSLAVPPAAPDVSRRARRLPDHILFGAAQPQLARPRRRRRPISSPPNPPPPPFSAFRRLPPSRAELPCEAHFTSFFFCSRGKTMSAATNASSIAARSLAMALEYASLHARLAVLEAQLDGTAGEPGPIPPKRGREDEVECVQPNSPPPEKLSRAPVASQRSPTHSPSVYHDPILASGYTARGTPARMAPSPQASAAPLEADTTAVDADETMDPAFLEETVVEAGATLEDWEAGATLEDCDYGRESAVNDSDADSAESRLGQNVDPPELAAHEAREVAEGSVAPPVPSPAAEDSERNDTVWAHPLVSVHTNEHQSRLCAPSSSTAAPLPALACACLPDGGIVVLHSERLHLWEKAAAGCRTAAPSEGRTTAQADTVRSWRLALCLEGEPHASYHTLALVPAFQARAATATPLPVLAACGGLGTPPGRPARDQGPRTRDQGAWPTREECGAAIFRLDRSDDLGRGPAPRRTAASRLVGPSEPTCAVLLPVPDLIGLDESGGTLLALGSVDGHVRLRRLSVPPSEQWETLPSPHDEEPCVLRGTSTSDVGAGGEERAEASPVLALCALSSELGLLVGAFAWGAALWQLTSRQLINVFERQGFPSPPPTTVLSGRRFLEWSRTPDRVGRSQLPNLTNGAAAVNAASLLVALPLPCVPADASGSWPGPGMDDDLGSVVVGSSLCWLSRGQRPGTMPGTEPVSDDRQAPSGHVGVGSACSANCTLARRFLVRRNGCHPAESFCAAPEMIGCGADDAVQAGAGGVAVEPKAELVSLATDGILLVGADRLGQIHIWSAQLAHCVAIVRAHGQSTTLLPVLLSPQIDTQGRPQGADARSGILLALDAREGLTTSFLLSWPAADQVKLQVKSSQVKPAADLVASAWRSARVAEPAPEPEHALKRASPRPAWRSCYEESQSLGGFDLTQSGSQMSPGSEDWRTGT